MSAGCASAGPAPSAPTSPRDPLAMVAMLGHAARMRPQNCRLWEQFSPPTRGAAASARSGAHSGSQGPSQKFSITPSGRMKASICSRIFALRRTSSCTLYSSGGSSGSFASTPGSTGTM